MSKLLLALTLPLYILVSCQQTNLHLELLETSVLDNIPGASGMANNDQYIFVVGDNSPYLYLLDHAGNQILTTAIYSTDEFRDGEIIKSLKPDFEAMELKSGKEHDEVIIFGSGSKSPNRDIFVQVTLSEEPIVKSFSLISFYNQIRSMDIMRGHELNIEAVALFENKLFLFNRSNNLIFEFPYDAFLNYMNRESKFPIPVVSKLKLPSIGNIEAGFSGASIIPGTNTIIFTASVEDTPNAYDDGDVLGSFICTIDLDQLNDPEKLNSILIEKIKEPWQIKVESVSILNKISDRELEIVMVTDSDGAESLLLKGKLEIR